MSVEGLKKFETVLVDAAGEPVGLVDVYYTVEFASGIEFPDSVADGQTTLVVSTRFHSVVYRPLEEDAGGA